MQKTHYAQMNLAVLQLLVSATMSREKMSFIVLPMIELLLTVKVAFVIDVADVAFSQLHRTVIIVSNAVVNIHLVTGNVSVTVPSLLTIPSPWFPAVL